MSILLDSNKGAALAASHNVTAKKLALWQQEEWTNGNRAGDPFCLHSTLETIAVEGGRTAYLCIGRPREVKDLASFALARIHKAGQQVVDQHRTQDCVAIVFIAAEREFDLPASVVEPDADAIALAKLRAWKR